MYYYKLLTMKPQFAYQLEIVHVSGSYENG